MKDIGHDIAYIAILAFAWGDCQKYKDLSLDSWLFSQDLNLESPVYRTVVLCTEL